MSQFFLRQGHLPTTKNRCDYGQPEKSKNLHQAGHTERILEHLNGQGQPKIRSDNNDVRNIHPERDAVRLPERSCRFPEKDELCPAKTYSNREGLCIHLLQPHPITSACPPLQTPKPASVPAISDLLHHNPVYSAPHPSQTPSHRPLDPPDFCSGTSPSTPLFC